MSFSPDVVLIVGAGFSANAGLPLANKFTECLLNLDGLNPAGPSAIQCRYIKEFVDQTFNEGAATPDDGWPELEDIFTIIDLSANTGHHLGTKYSAANLRLVRRALLVRIVRMLRQAHTTHRKSGASSKLLSKLFFWFDLENTAVLSMNWDTVFEREIADAQMVTRVDYGCEATSKQFVKGELKSRLHHDTKTLHLLKPHGSINWLYCDACRELFWVPPAQTESVARSLFQERDWNTIFGSSPPTAAPPTLRPSCPHCTAQSLGTRIATFSYRKALDFPMYGASWRTGESYLKDASHWVFFGYSMPSADFEFKHMLKRVQLTERLRPRITVITGGTVEAQLATKERFRKFFGDKPLERKYFDVAQTDEILDHLQAVGALRSFNPRRRFRTS